MELCKLANYNVSENTKKKCLWCLPYIAFENLRG